MANYLVTGAAGFIGFHLCKRLLDDGNSVVGIDNLNSYYDVSLKLARLNILQQFSNFNFYKTEIADLPGMEAIFSGHSNLSFDVVINLAAQPGVRYSLKNPHSYISSNIVGFTNILECCRHNNVKHLVFASSSSIYGMNKKIPFSVSDNVDHPVSLYAASKKANELMAHTYAHLYGLPCTGLRFFTAYGPWGRPDMAYFSFTKGIMEGTPIDVFNFGKMKRDFTYIDDVSTAIETIIGKPAQGDKQAGMPPHAIYNLGNSRPNTVLELVAAIEKATGRTAERILAPTQPGDVTVTFADHARATAAFGFAPKTGLEEGIANFVAWRAGS